MGDGYEDLDLVFARTDGSMLAADAVLHRLPAH